jgi:hypothetical protein
VEPTLNRLMAQAPIDGVGDILDRYMFGGSLARPFFATAWMILHVLNSASVIYRFALPWRTTDGTVASIAPLPRVFVLPPHDRSGWAVWAAAC